MTAKHTNQGRNPDLHSIREYGVEILHQQAKLDGKTEIILIVFRDGRFLEMACFDCLAFNTADLRRRMKSLSAFPARAFDAVVEDARAWPKAKPSSSMKAMSRKKMIRKTGKREASE